MTLTRVTNERVMYLGRLVAVQFSSRAAICVARRSTVVVRQPG